MIFLRALLILSSLDPTLCAADSTTAYRFTDFTKNGEDGLHLAWSADGYTWDNDGRPSLAPTVGHAKLLRAPCVARGPDGTYHLVWTSGGNENNLGCASSPDFLTRSDQREIPFMAHEPTVLNSWAPEISTTKNAPGLSSP